MTVPQILWNLWFALIFLAVVLAFELPAGVIVIGYVANAIGYVEGLFVERVRHHVALDEKGLRS